MLTAAVFWRGGRGDKYMRMELEMFQLKRENPQKPFQSDSKWMK